MRFDQKIAVTCVTTMMAWLCLQDSMFHNGVAAHTGTAGTSLGYTGQYIDAESGFVYLRARFYDPTTAEFLTVDPKVGETRAPYIYTGDNPVNGADPSGEPGV